ncbi:hypothetical protein BDZ45DRAFT_753680 [Acephala macrosclerotiorum]|nr:hypothetical protein BDZ45DRAFT_753680 [Acephala macrosclerotiorum]
MGTTFVTAKAVPNLVEYSDSDSDEEFFDARDPDNPIEATPTVLPSIEPKTESPTGISKEEGHFNARSADGFEQSAASEGDLSKPNSQRNNSDSVGIPGYHTEARAISLQDNLEGGGVETSGHGKGGDEDVEIGGVGEMEIKREGAPSPASIDRTPSDDQLMKETIDENEEYEPAGAKDGSKGKWTRANKSSAELLDHYSYFYGV